MKVFNDTLTGLQKSVDGYRKVKDGLEAEIATLEATKAEVTSKMATADAFAKKIEDFLSC